MTVIAHGKVEPMDMAPCIRIDAHEQIVFAGSNFDGYVQVAAFKVRIKDDLILQIDGGVHAAE
jgi:hypothetical protein